MLEAMRCMLLCMLDAVESGLSFGGFEISIVAVFSLTVRQHLAACLFRSGVTPR